MISPVEKSTHQNAIVLHCPSTDQSGERWPLSTYIRGVKVSDVTGPATVRMFFYL